MSILARKVRIVITHYINIVSRLVVPHCLMWTIWRDCNYRTFEGLKKSVINIKYTFLHLQFECCIVILLGINTFMTVIL